jgi:hypothetical protein
MHTTEDQRGDQAIFDCGDAGFVLEKTSDNCFHVQLLNSSVNRVLPCGAAHRREWRD